MIKEGNEDKQKFNKLLVKRSTSMLQGSMDNKRGFLFVCLCLFFVLHYVLVEKEVGIFTDYVIVTNEREYKLKKKEKIVGVIS